MKTSDLAWKEGPFAAGGRLEADKTTLQQLFDGYTSCPLTTREGSALPIEFDYPGKLTPSLPMIEPLQDSYFAWLMKYRMLKPAYMAVHKGRV